MCDAYRQLRHELFCEDTGMIYDSICSGNHELRFEHLPYLEEIQANTPNPHGYATGMEDSMLNAGFAIEMCICRAEAEPEKRDECEDFARRLLQGMFRCSNVHGHRGYVVRSVSHRDKSSCYMESSRDQFTLFVYGLWRYFHSPFAKPNEKNAIRKELCAVADFAESRMSQEYSCNLGRLDGFPGVHLQMLGVQSHEAMRLPMFFAAAFDVNENTRYHELYLKYVEQALTESARMLESTRPWWHIELSQMQISLSLCRAVDDIPEHKVCIDHLIKHIAGIAEKQAIDYHFSQMSEYSGSWAPLSHAWRESDRFSLQLFSEGKSAMRGGKIYLKGEENQDFKEAFDRIRATGNIITSILLAPDYNSSPDFWNKFVECAAIPEYGQHTSGGLVNILCAYFLARKRGKIPAICGLRKLASSPRKRQKSKTNQNEKRRDLNK